MISLPLHNTLTEKQATNCAGGGSLAADKLCIRVDWNATLETAGVAAPGVIVNVTPQGMVFVPRDQSTAGVWETGAPATAVLADNSERLSGTIVFVAKKQQLDVPGFAINIGLSAPSSDILERFCVLAQRACAVDGDLQRVINGRNVHKLNNVRQQVRFAVEMCSYDVSETTLGLLEQSVAEACAELFEIARSWLARPAIAGPTRTGPRHRVRRSRTTKRRRTSKRVFS